MTAIVSLRTKTAKEMLEQFKDYQAIVEKQLGHKIKRVRTDRGGEFRGKFEKYIEQQGIIHEITAPYSPDQNRVAERVNRTIMERTRAVLADAKLLKELWMEIAKTVVYLKNRSPTSALSITPYEAWFGTKPDLSHLRITGSPAYVHIPEEKRIKLDSHSIKGQLIGYGGTNQYRVWDPMKENVIVS
jgi:transposase InsO family protein